MKNNKSEIELIKKLKDSFPDILDFNNCLKELRTFWRKEMLDDEIKFLEKLKLEDVAEESDLVNERLSKLKCAKDNL